MEASDSASVEPTEDFVPVEIVDTPRRVDSALIGRAIAVPLNTTPSPEWTALVGQARELSTYFARIRFEGDQLLLYPGSRAAARDIGSALDELPMSSALDELQHAIDRANEATRDTRARERRNAAELREQVQRDNEQLDAGLAEWGRRHVNTSDH